MDTEQPENKSFISIVHDFDRLPEKKAQKRENTLLSFVMKAVARDQEHYILISKLQKELARAQGLMNLLEMENEVKEKLVKEKEEEIKALKDEIQMLKNATIDNNNTRRASLNHLEAIKQETPSKLNRFIDVISTQNNIVATPTGSENDDVDVVSSSKGDLTECKDVTPKLKAKIVKKRSTKRFSKETNVSSFLYNLRNRKSKTNEKI